MKKILITLTLFIAFAGTVNADETWRELFVTRLMKLMNSSPSYTDIALTDLDQNGVPEAFLLKKGINGGINTGITLKENMLVSIETPSNVMGACLEDITVYDVNGENVFVGKEVGRYSGNIEYFKLSLSGNVLKCEPVKKNDFSSYAALPYEDIFDDDFYEGDYPNRTKLQNFINKYAFQTHINVRPATAKVSVDGNAVDLSGIFVNESNYYKIRDVAMVLSTGVNRFSISWDSARAAISLTTGKKYVPVGGELSGDVDLANAIVEQTNAKIIVNGVEHTIEAYNINGNNYFKIRDISGLVGFDVGWDNATGTVTISSN